MPDLTGFEALVSVGNSRTVSLSSGSLAVLLSALELIGASYQWIGTADDGRLTVAEKDRVDGYIDTATYELMKAASMKAIGEIFWKAMSTVPAGSLPMDGSSYAQADYPQLMSEIPTVWKSGSIFTLPNMGAKTLVGAGFTYYPTPNSGVTVNAGGTGGEHRHVLTTEEMPAHSHDVPRSTGTTSGTGGFSAQSYNPTASVVVSAQSGGGQAHNNMPPFLAAFAFIQAE